MRGGNIKQFDDRVAEIARAATDAGIDLDQDRAQLAEGVGDTLGSPCPRPVEEVMVSEGKTVKMMNPQPVLTTDDLRLLQRLVRAEEQAQPPKSRKQRIAQRVARKLTALRKSAY